MLSLQAVIQKAEVLSKDAVFCVLELFQIIL